MQVRTRWRGCWRECKALSRFRYGPDSTVTKVPPGMAVVEGEASTLMTKKLV